VDISVKKTEKTLEKRYLRKENGEDSGENGENGENTNGNGNGGNGNGGGVSESKSGDSSLRDWFGKSRSSDGKPGWWQIWLG
jgi:hypothetical protein